MVTSFAKAVIAHAFSDGTLDSLTGASIPVGQGGHVPPIFGPGDMITNVPPIFLA